MDAKKRARALEKKRVFAARFGGVFCPVARTLYDFKVLKYRGRSYRQDAMPDA